MRRLALLLCLLTAVPAGADTLRVPDDAPDLAAAVAAASLGDTVLVAPGVHHACDVIVTLGMVLRGTTGNPADVVLDAGGCGRLFAVEEAWGPVRIEALTLRGGRPDGPGGAVTATGSTLRFRACRFEDNVAAGAGGAVHAVDCGLVEFVDCDLVDNAANAPDVAVPGGALAYYGGTVQGTVWMTRCTVAGSAAGGPGGALYIDDGGLRMIDTVVTGSRSGLVAWPAGAGVFLRRTQASPGSPGTPPLPVVVDGCTITDNVGNVGEAPYAGDGGGMLVKGFDADNMYDVLVTGTVFADNFNAQGAGLYVGRYAAGQAQRCRFLRNRAYINGGGAAKGGRWPNCVGETLRFTFCEFVGNEAGYDRDGLTGTDTGYGGGFYTRYYPRAEFVHCGFRDNRSGGADPRGDAVYHNAEGRTFLNDLQRCAVVNTAFWGANGLDVQLRADAAGFSTVDHAALGAGQYLCEGVTPTATVPLAADPFRAGSADTHPGPASPLQDAAASLGMGPDIVGTPVPVGPAPDIGAWEAAEVSGVAPDADPRRGPSLVAAPNPFNPRTTVAWNLAAGGPVRLTAHDLAGRRVRTLLDRVLPAGPHAVAWDGRDDGGRALASGIYLLRLQTRRDVSTARVVLLK